MWNKWIDNPPPKDQDVLYYDGVSEAFEVVYYVQHKDVWTTNDDTNYDNPVIPDHKDYWMELPKPPKMNFSKITTTANKFGKYHIIRPKHKDRTDDYALSICGIETKRMKMGRTHSEMCEEYWKEDGKKFYLKERPDGSLVELNDPHICKTCLWLSSKGVKEQAEQMRLHKI